MSDTNSSGNELRATVADEQESMRLDRFLAASLTDHSRSRLEGLIEAGAVALGGETIRDTNHRVKPGEEYSVHPARAEAGAAARRRIFRSRSSMKTKT